MKLNWQKFLFITGLLLAWLIIPFLITWQEFTRIWDDLHVLRSIKFQYRDTTKDFLEVWKFDFDVDKINKARQDKKIK